MAELVGVDDRDRFGHLAIAPVEHRQQIRLSVAHDVGVQYGGDWQSLASSAASTAFDWELNRCPICIEEAGWLLHLRFDEAFGSQWIDLVSEACPIVGCPPGGIPVCRPNEGSDASRLSWRSSTGHFSSRVIMRWTDLDPSCQHLADMKLPIEIGHGTPLSRRLRYTHIKFDTSPRLR